MTVYTFSHLIEPWILPPGINFLIIVFGIVISFIFRCTGRLIALIGLVSLWLLSTPIIAYKLLNTLQNQYPLLQTSSLAQNNSQDVIIVLGGGNTVEKEYGNKETVSDFTLHRVNYAGYLSQQTHLPIIVSGGRYSLSEQSEADLMFDVLKNHFNIKSILKEDKSATTADESRLMIPILKENHFKRAYIVTDAWHMPRSMYIFQCRGINAIAAPMGYIVYGPGYSLLSFFPNVQSLSASNIALHEYIGLVWYHLRYGQTCIKRSP